jgi:hypothetical protein
MAKYMDVKMKVDLGGVQKLTREKTRQLTELPKRALDFFIAQTPIDTGYARRQTRLEGDKTIHADYAYADRLNNGWSIQAPRGMVKPTQDWLYREFKKIFKK